MNVGKQKLIKNEKCVSETLFLCGWFGGYGGRVGGLGGWEGVLEGSKIHFKDCLQQLKTITNDYLAD